MLKNLINQANFLLRKSLECCSFLRITSPLVECPYIFNEKLSLYCSYNREKEGINIIKVNVLPKKHAYKFVLEESYQLAQWNRFLSSKEGAGEAVAGFCYVFLITIWLLYSRKRNGTAVIDCTICLCVWYFTLSLFALPVLSIEDSVTATAMGIALVIQFVLGLAL